jgi:PhnB protein
MAARRIGVPYVVGGAPIVTAPTQKSAISPGNSERRNASRRQPGRACVDPKQIIGDVTITGLFPSSAAGKSLSNKTPSNTLVPYLMCHDTAAAIDWYKDVLGATEPRVRLTTPSGECMNAELWIGSSRLMLADATPSVGSVSPHDQPGTSVVIDLLVDDVDAVFARAIAAGATEVFAVSDQFYGQRTGRFRDPFGHAWFVATVIRDVPDDEMHAAFLAMFN